MEDRLSASRTDVGGNFPRYSAAVLGFRNYWYPVMLARNLRKRPRAVTLCGERMVLVRDQGRVYALHDRCPRCGVPLAAGRREAPGTLACPHDGGAFDVQTGWPDGRLTGGPDAPVGGSASVPTYPVEERAGLIWAYIGAEPRPPVERDMPRELLRPHTVVEGVISRQKGNWRYAAENGIDEGHVRYLHRRGFYTFFREIPAWTTLRMGPSADGEWLTRIVENVVWSDEYPELGRWPRSVPFWESRARGALEIGIRLPCWLRIQQHGWTSFEMYVPSDANHYLSGLLLCGQARGLAAARFHAKYLLWYRWAYHGLFHNADQWIIEQMEIPPERLFRPDASITAWRKLCDDDSRGEPIPAAPPAGGRTREPAGVGGAVAG
jgi:nitrite reductase/ring-hydroxylating ferredoxin subunit